MFAEPGAVNHPTAISTNEKTIATAQFEKKHRFGAGTLFTGGGGWQWREQEATTAVLQQAEHSQNHSIMGKRMGI